MGEKNIIIKFDEDFIEEACEFSIMKTIIHESLHAELFRILNDSTIDLNDFPALYEALRVKNGWQHDYMSNWYRGLIVQSLKDIYGESYTDEEYNAMAWAGLDEYEVVVIPGEGENYFVPITEAWSLMSESEKIMIRNIQNDLKIDCNEDCEKYIDVCFIVNGFFKLC